MFQRVRETDGRSHDDKLQEAAKRHNSAKKKQERLAKRLERKHSQVTSEATQSPATSPFDVDQQPPANGESA